MGRKSTKAGRDTVRCSKDVEQSHNLYRKKRKKIDIHISILCCTRRKVNLKKKKKIDHHHYHHYQIQISCRQGTTLLGSIAKSES